MSEILLAVFEPTEVKTTQELLMLFVSIPSPEYLPISQQAAVELRLDLFPKIDLQILEKWLKESKFLVMFTLRKKSQGGKFTEDEQKREALIEELLRLRPSFFDLEYDMRPEFLHSVIQRYPETKCILSFHDFTRGLNSLDSIISSMQKIPAFGYKIACMPPSSIEALKMLLIAKKHPKVSVICMGADAKFTRVLGPIVGNVLNFGSVNVKEETAPGQISHAEWTDIYRYEGLNGDTKIYGLIGDPVEQSFGHIYHNEVFRKKNRNAVYVKMQIKKGMLSEFIPLAKELKIRGLSVTVPHKEDILPFVDFLDEDARQIGAVNTLKFKEGKIFGTNTDGKGALDAIEKKKSVHGKKVVILGAGGSARAIAFEAKKRGADVLILNRTLERAQKIAEDLGCRSGNIDDIPVSYDIVINCSLAPIPMDFQKILPGKVAMDIIYSPKVTSFLQEALLRKCEVVYGEEMFFNQAARQSQFWMG